MWQFHGWSKPDERLGDAPATQDRDAAVEQISTGRRRPRGRRRVLADVAQTGQREGERHLGDRLRVDTLAAGPRVLVVEMVDEVLDAGKRELDPTQVRSLADRVAERIGMPGVAPHDRLALVESDEMAAPVADRLLEPFGRTGGAEGDGERITILHVLANRSVRAFTDR